MEYLEKTNKDDTTNEFVELLQEYADTLLSEQLEVIPLLGYGMTIAKAAKASKLPVEKIRLWVNTDPIFQEALDKFREGHRNYHEMMLNQAGAIAWGVLFKYLGHNADDVVSQRIQADLVKFVIQQVTTKTTKTEIKHTVEPKLNVTEDSAMLIAEKLKQLDRGEDAVDAEFRVTAEPSKNDDENAGMRVAQALDKFEGKDSDAEIKEVSKSGSYIMHPSATYGKMTMNDKKNRWLCHICGEWTADVVVHIRTEHKLSPARYRNMYGISEDAPLYFSEPRLADDNEIEDFNQSLNE